MIRQSRFFFGHFQVTRLGLIGLCLLFIFSVHNRTFFGKALDIFHGHVFELISLTILLALSVTLCLVLLNWPYVLKGVLVYILIVSAASSFYVDHLGIFIDKDLLINIFATTYDEARHLLTWPYLLHLLLLGLLPACLVLILPLKDQNLTGIIKLNLATSAICLLVGLTLLIMNFAAFSSITRERRDLMASFIPGAPIVNFVRYKPQRKSQSPSA